MAAKYRHRGLSAALGSPAIAYAEGSCVGGSTEINSALYHRLPPDLAAEWARRYQIDEFTPDVLDRYGDEIEAELSVAKLPGAPPVSSAVLERGATKLGWRAVEFDRMFAYDGAGRGTKQTMTRTLRAPRARPRRTDPRRVPRRQAAPAGATASSAPGAASATPTGASTT